MNAEGERIRHAIRRHTIRRNTREACALIGAVYLLCGFAAWAILAS